MTLTTEEKRNVLRRISGEVFGQGNMEAVDELIAPDFVDHDPLPGFSPDREGLKQVVQLFRSAFPDFEVELMHTIVEGDKAVDHIASTGTHLGEFMGVPATGKRIRASAVVISEFDPDGRIAERSARRLRRAGDLPDRRWADRLDVVPDGPARIDEPARRRRGAAGGAGGVLNLRSERGRKSGEA